MKTLQQGLKKWSKKNNMQSPQEKQPAVKKPGNAHKEKFSTRDIEELMGMNMRTYHRGKGGSMKQR